MQEYIQKLEKEGILILKLRIKAQASKTAFLRVLDDETIKISVKTVAEKGQANKELVRYLTKSFGVEKENVKIVSGKKTRNKIIKIIKK